MSDLQRGGRLPMFIDEAQWSAAYEAAQREVALLRCQGLLDLPDEGQWLAVRIATAALRAAAVAAEDGEDITDMAGVAVEFPDL